MKNKTVVITGGGGVLCSTFAKALAGDGFSVALLDIDKKAVEEIACEIVKSGGKAAGFQANVLMRVSAHAAS